jgi:PAS domain S-box-containing protein
MTGNLQITPENYLDLLDVCPNALLIITEKKEIVFANSAAAELFDYSREEIIGTPLNRIISGELPGCKEDLLAAAPERVGLFKRQQLIAKCPQVEIQGIRKNRTRFLLELSLSMYRGKEGTALVLAILRDITLKKKIESELEQWAGNLGMYLQLVTAMNSAADLDEVLEAIADGMVKVFGYTGSLVFLDEEGKGEAITLKAFAYDYEPRIIKKVEKLLGFSLKEHKFNPEKDHTIHRLYSEKQPLISNDISGSLAGLFRREIYKKLVSVVAGLLPIASALSVPLLVSGEVRGVLVVAGQRKMNENDVSRVQTLATHAALAIEKARLFQEEIHQRRVKETLYAIAQVIGSTLELDDVLHRILGQLKKVIVCQAAAIMLIDEERKNLYVKVVDGFDKEAVKISLPLDGKRGVGVQVVRTGEPKYVPDIAKDKRHVSGGIERGSELAVPLKIDEIIGVLNLESEEIDAFSRYDLQLLSAFAGQAGIAIENARLFEAEQSRRRLAETLGEVSRAVGSILDPDSLLLMILEQLKKILAYGTASIMLFPRQKPSIAATLGYKDKELVRREMPLRLRHSPIFKKLIRTRRPIIIRDVRKEKDWIWVPGARNVRSWIGVPLIAGNEVMGVLSIDSSKAGFFTGKDVEAVQALANQTAMAIENARLFKDLNEEKGRLELLYDISSQFTSDQKLDQMLARIIDRITAELGGLIGHLFSLEPDGKHLRLHAIGGV